MKILLKTLQDVNGADENTSFLSICKYFKIQPRVSIKTNSFLVNRERFFGGLEIFFELK